MTRFAFLTHSELSEMTGYKARSKQVGWLVENGYHFDVRSDGRPNVLVEQVHERQCKGASQGEKTKPNFAALES